MPRKSREKDAQSPREKKEAARAKDEAMPQVWLPDQPDTEDSGSYPFLSPSHDPTPPTAEEQQHVAEYWAEEEERLPRGWDEEQELDYSEVVRRREEREMSEPPGDIGEDTTDFFKYWRSTHYPVRYLGHIPHLPPPSLPSSSSATAAAAAGGSGGDSQTAILAIIDKAQKRGLLPWVTSDSDQRLLSVSKYGIKVTDTRKQRIFARHALHYIIDITHYEDTYGKHMLAVKVATTTTDQQQQQKSLHIYEAEDEGQAQEICLTLAQAFDVVHSNLRLQQNLTSDPR